jgi:hypothetical protein
MASNQAAPLLRAVAGPAGRSRPARHHDVHVLFDDGSWQQAMVLAWGRDAQREWLVLLRWPNGREEWRKYDRRCIHPV